MRRPALAALAVFAAVTAGAVAPRPAAANQGPAYYEALMQYCYGGGLAERIGRDPDSRSVTGIASKRAALKDLRGAMADGEKAATALCASGYYRAIQAGYVTVIRDTRPD